MKREAIWEGNRIVWAEIVAKRKCMNCLKLPRKED
jgi:hypothetical protein